MKRAAYLLVCVFICFSFAFGCSNEKPAQTAVTKEQCTVEDFTRLYSQYCAEHNLPLETSRNDMTPEENQKYFKIVDITPEAVYNEIGCKIFKVNSTCETCIVYQDKMYWIGMGFGGWGVVDIKTCNFDNDPRKDLLFTYSWGSGLHRSLLSVFNFTTMQEQQLEYMNPSNDMILEKISDREFKVYSASVDSKAELDYCHLQSTKLDLLLKVVSENGKPKLIGATGQSSPASN